MSAPSLNNLKKHPYKTINKLNNIALSKWRSSEKRCVICGKYGETTKDHIPPQSIYVKTPKDVVTVPACEKCQKSPDREFSEFLVSYCIQNGETDTSTKLLDYRNKRSKTKGLSDKCIQYLREKSDLKRIFIKTDTGLIIPALGGTWPRELHDPIILKMVHGYYWLLTGGNILSDEAGKVVITNNYKPTTKEGNFLTGRAFPSINIGNNQFICTYIEGFEEEPYNIIVSIGFHFHTNNCPALGYHTLAFLCPDKIAKKEVELVRRTLREASNESIYDLQKPVYNYYPF